MKLTLRRLREQKGWKLKQAAREFNIDVKTLKDFEEYRKVPSSNELIKMLRIMDFYFDEIVNIIYADIERKYKSERKSNN